MSTLGMTEVAAGATVLSLVLFCIRSYFTLENKVESKVSKEEFLALKAEVDLNHKVSLVNEVFIRESLARIEKGMSEINKRIDEIMESKSK